MADEFDKIMDRAGALTGTRNRKYYTDFDEPPSNAEVAKAIKGMQGEISDQLAWTFEVVRLLVSIKKAVWIIAYAAVVVATIVGIYAWNHNVSG